MPHFGTGKAAACSYRSHRMAKWQRYHDRHDRANFAKHTSIAAAAQRALHGNSGSTANGAIPPAWSSSTTILCQFATSENRKEN